MTNENFNIEMGRHIYISSIESELKRLEYQRTRILSYQPKSEGWNFPSPSHDADFYMVLLRRLYREIENLAKTDSRVANLKGQYKQLWPKIKIRDHFEHEVDLDTLPPIIPGIKVLCGVAINETNPHIMSGNQKWQLNDDHNAFVEMIQKMIRLYPFS